MRHIARSIFISATLVGLIFGSAESTSAQHFGLYRTSATSEPAHERPPASNLQTQPAPNGVGDYHYYENCGEGGCECESDECCPRHYCYLYGWLPCDGGCTHSADYGWTRPMKYPIRRIPVEYHRYWPTRWYGEPGTVPPPATNRGFPMVYMPTDTTQLGFYYQRVPQWRPNPAMIPPAPWPTQWHHREFCNRSDCGYVDYEGEPAQDSAAESSAGGENGNEDRGAGQQPAKSPEPTARYYPGMRVQPVGY